jgi:branched-chain amino acid transport system permease protein
MLLPVFQSKSPTLAAALFIVVGVGAVMLGRDPNGLANKAFRLGNAIQRLLPVFNRPPGPNVRQTTPIAEAGHATA